jgi:hypothetical protein
MKKGPRGRGLFKPVQRNHRRRGKVKKFLIAIIFSFIMSSMAEAECAWVLWLKHCSFVAKTGENLKCEWELNEAYPTHEQCMSVRENIWTGYKKMFLKSDGVPFGYLNLNKDSDTALTIDFRCFPDTIDPRK